MSKSKNYSEVLMALLTALNAASSSTHSADLCQSIADMARIVLSRLVHQMREETQIAVNELNNKCERDISGYVKAFECAVAAIKGKESGDE